MKRFLHALAFALETACPFICGVYATICFYEGSQTSALFFSIVGLVASHSNRVISFRIGRAKGIHDVVDIVETVRDELVELSEGRQ